MQKQKIINTFSITEGYIGNLGSMNRGQHTTVWVEPLRGELLGDRISN